MWNGVPSAMLRMEVEAEVLEGSPVRSAFAGVVAEQQDVVVGRSHAVGP